MHVETNPFFTPTHFFLFSRRFHLDTPVGDHGPCPHGPGPHPHVPKHCRSDGDTSSSGSNVNSASDGDYTGADGASGSSSNSDNADVTSSGNLITSSVRSNWLLWAVAGAAAVAAGIAIVYGQRKRERETHPLRGSVGRRMSLFSNFADSACDNACAGKDSVEMVSAKGDYRLS